MEDYQFHLGMMGESHSPDDAQSEPEGTGRAGEQAWGNEDKWSLSTSDVGHTEIAHFTLTPSR